ACPAPSPPSLHDALPIFFIPLTFTISCSLFASFLVSRTVTPLLCLHWLTPEAPSTAANPGLYTRVFQWSGRALGRMDETYQRLRSEEHTSELQSRVDLVR